jgi:hypothetical protein
VVALGSQTKEPSHAPSPARPLAALTLLALPAVAKDPALGTSTFVVYEAFLSPAQEPGEESETPKALKKLAGGHAAVYAAGGAQITGLG